MDLDADGRKDLVSGSWPGEVYWFRRKPNGTHAAGEPLRTASGQVNVGRASAVAVTDWDGDGDFDLVIGTVDGAVFLVPNEGDPRKPVFGKSRPVLASGTPLRVDGDAGPHVADWDGDGKSDLLVGAQSGAVQWFRNSGPGRPVELAAGSVLVESTELRSAGPPKRSMGRSKPAVADWNGDGRPDLVVGDFWSDPGAGGGSATHGGVWVYLRRDRP